MNLKKYSDWFHDGGLINIEHNHDQIEISMESSPVGLDWNENEDNILLSKYQTIRGKLHLEGVKSITVGHVPSDKIKIIYDNGEILNLDILSDHKISLLIEWKNFPPKPKTYHCDLIEIEADKIYWENIPDLKDRIDLEDDME